MALSSCAHQDLAGACLCNYASVLDVDQNQLVKKMIVILTEENMHLRREAHLEHGDDGEPKEGTGSG